MVQMNTDFVFQKIIGERGRPGDAVFVAINALHAQVVSDGSGGVHVFDRNYLKRSPDGQCWGQQLCDDEN